MDSNTQSSLSYIDEELYQLGKDESPKDYPTQDEKQEKTREVIRTALQEYSNPAVMWTGGKDSTLVLYFVKEVADELGVETPPVVFIDHGQHFEIVESFIEKWADRWSLDIIYARNENLLQLADEPNEEIRVDELDEENQFEVREKLGYEEETFPFALNTEVGNHLLKTVALNSVLEEYEFDSVFSGIRWDEQESRADETFFSPRHDSDKYPPHDRVHPILQYTEADVWDALWGTVVPSVTPEMAGMKVPHSVEDMPEGIEVDEIPICKLYFEGYRSLGSETETMKSADEPAWVQDMENTVERAGRAQDKEGVMERLRDLGYM